MKNAKADYGIDAPNIVKNLFLFSFISLILSIFSFFPIQSTLWFWIVFVYFFSTFLSLFITGCWMLYGIKIAKPKIILKIVQDLKLIGNEKLLDLGCGRGMLLCEAAKHLPDGEAHGIDIWSNKDQSGNKLEKTLENAAREGVKEKINIHTGDVRCLPFPDNTFDVVVSSLCLHNINDKNERDKSLLEMLRVLKTGGGFTIADIHHAKAYAEFLKTQNINVEYSKSNYSYCPQLGIIKGKKS